MPKISPRWSEDVTLRFVSEYLKHDSLWNVKSEQYKDKQARQAAYIDLENVMNIPEFTENEIKLKIKNIRSTYSQELRKIKDSKKSGSDPVYVPSVKWFKLLNHALRNVQVKIEETHNDLTPNTDLINPVEESLEDSKPEPIPTPDISHQQPIAPICKRQRLIQFKTMVNQLNGMPDTVNTLEDNEFEVFGKNVGLQLKAMPVQIALEAQLHIQAYLTRIRLQHMASDQNRDLQPTPIPSSCSDSTNSMMSVGENIQSSTQYCEAILDDTRTKISAPGRCTKCKIQSKIFDKVFELIFEPH